MCSTTKSIWRQADAVCFDVDSTVIQEEGIDELANFCNKGCEVTNLTAMAMSGKVTFQESLTQRLNIIRPSLSLVKSFIETRPTNLTPGIKDLIELLNAKSVPVYLISGGFDCIIEPVAKQLAIPIKHVYANRFKFFYNGDYAGFDENAYTSRSGGKAAVINVLKHEHGYKNVVLIGDGATDLEASPPADAFIGFGGNVIREEVRAKAKWFVTDFNELIEALNQ